MTKPITALLFALITMVSTVGFSDSVAEIACRGFGTTLDNCDRMVGTYNCKWTGCTSADPIYAGVCHINKDVNACDQNSAGGKCEWGGCHTQNPN